MSEETKETMDQEPQTDNVEGQQEEQQAEQAEQETADTSSEATESADSDDKEEATVADPEPEEVDPLVAANEQIAKLKDQLLRTIAEFENFKKRTIKEKTDLILNGGQKTVAAILPVMDDIERALADKSEDPAAIREGVKMIFNKFEKSLESLGVKKIDAVGQDFDTDYHEAIAMVPGMGDDKKGKVIDCVQTGYTMNDKVIRHAKVAVGQ